VPADRDYQLWVIRNQTPVSAGVFSIRNDEGELFFRIDNLAETDKTIINAFAITLEPAGGVPQPTGPMYLIGNPL
jgi:anti-sigma-K factor RskA